MTGPFRCSGDDLALARRVADAIPTQQREYRQSLYRICRGFGVPVEPHVMTEETFEETRSVIGGLAYPASVEGVTLYPNTWAGAAGLGEGLIR